jgi:hypothetical protein
VFLCRTERNGQVLIDVGVHRQHRKTDGHQMANQ